MLLFFCILVFQPVENLTVGKIRRKFEGTTTQFLNGPSDLAVSGDSVYAIDRHENALWKINLSDHSALVFGGGGDGPGELVKPEALYEFNANLYVVHKFRSRIERLSIDGKYLDRITPPAGFHHIISFDQNRVYSRMDQPGMVLWESSQDGEEIIVNHGDEADQIRTFLGEYRDGVIFICSKASLSNRVYYTAIDTKNQAVIDVASFLTVQKTRTEDYPKEIPKTATFFANTIASLTSSNELGFLMVERALKISPEYSYVWRYSPSEGLSKFRFKYAPLGGWPETLLHLGESRWAAGVDDAVVFFEMSPPG